MAATLVNAVADIPASPTAGDIVRFGTAISTGIPSNVKKANGTTTETSITVGSEYRYIGTNWMRIGGDVIETTPLKDASVLDSGEFASMILGAVHNDLDSGELRQFGTSLLHQALQSANPIQVGLETTIMFERNYGSEVALSGTINLDIESGTIRHSFNGGYFGYLFIVTEHQAASTAKRLYPRFIWQEDIDIVYPTGDDPIFGTAHNMSSSRLFFIRKINNTSFEGRTSDTYLQKIIGYKLAVSLETP